MKIKKKVTTIFLASLMSLFLCAQQQEEKVDITEISLEELLNTEVTVAGKKAQKIFEAPAIISVITADDLKLMGATNLYEALSFIPGVNLTETFYGFTSVSFRGNLQTHYNNKSLLLINNHPMYDTSVGSFYLEAIPINSIDRIEIIRGPGSILYGTNAYGGVIKVVTKETVSSKNGEIKLIGGSFTTFNPSVGFSYNKNEFSIALFVDYFNSKGYDYNVKADEEKRSGTIKYKDNYLNGLFSLNYKGLKVNAGYYTNDKDKFGLVPTLVSTGERTNQGWYGDASLNFKLSKKLNLTALAYYDYYSKDEIISWYPPLYSSQRAGVGGKQKQELSCDKIGLELSSIFQISSVTSLMGGILYEYQHSDPYYFKKYESGEVDKITSAYLEEHSTRDLAVYIQLETKIAQKLGLVAGLRLNDNKDYGTKLTPRAGAVYNFSSRFSLKALYGQAFRNPNFFEKYVATVNVLFGDEKLTPEKIDTFDLGMDWIFTKDNSLRVNYFYLSTNDLIARSKIIPAGQKGNTRNTPQYGNSLGQKISGLEAELKGRMIKRIDYFLNVSSIFSAKEKKDDSDVFFVPKFLSNGGFNIKFGKFTVSPYYQYVSAKKGKLANGTAVEVASYLLLNLNLLYEINKNISLQLIGKNLTDKEYSYPEYIRRNVVEIPGGPGFQIYARAIIGF